MVELCKEVFTAVLGDRPNQLDKKREDVHVTAEQLLDVRSTPGEVTGPVVVLKIDKPEDVQKYKGKLKGAILLTSPPAKVPLGEEQYPPENAYDAVIPPQLGGELPDDRLVVLHVVRLSPGADGGNDRRIEACLDRQRGVRVPLVL